MPKTYVLVGADHNGSFARDVKAWEDRAEKKGDVVFIRAEDVPSIEAAAKLAEGGNIVLLAHGATDGTFVWKEGESRPSYTKLFENLPPQGVESVTICSCYGGSAVSGKMLESAPAGVLIQSKVGALTEGYTHDGGAEMAAITNVTPLAIFLEALDDINPDKLAELGKHWNKSGKYSGLNEDPNNVLPHTIGLGGHPPVKVDLDEKMAELSAKGEAGTLGKTSFDLAVAKVKEHFDPSQWNVKDQAELNKKIDDVAEKLKAGANTKEFSLEEKRIAYGLTAANLYQTGEMEQLRAKAVNATGSQTLSAYEASVRQNLAARGTNPSVQENEVKHSVQSHRNDNDTDLNKFIDDTNRQTEAWRDLKTNVRQSLIAGGITDETKINKRVQEVVDQVNHSQGGSQTRTDFIVATSNAYAEKAREEVPRRRDGQGAEQGQSRPDQSQHQEQQRGPHVEHKGSLASRAASMFSAVFRSMDTDQDKHVSQDEVNKARDSWDTNRDGQISRDEITVAVRHASGRGANEEMGIGEKSAITRVERALKENERAATKELVNSVVNTIDRDGKKGISKDEAHIAVISLDRNNDGKVSSSEISVAIRRANGLADNIKLAGEKEAISQIGKMLRASGVQFVAELDAGTPVRPTETGGKGAATQRNV